MTANLNGLIPDATGVILVNVNRFGTGTVGYLNGSAIEEYSAGITLLNPANLYAEPLSRNSVQVYWSDRSVIKTQTMVMNSRGQQIPCSAEPCKL